MRMIKIHKNKILNYILLSIISLVVIFGLTKLYILHRAHSSFENYAKFRGCTQMIGETLNFGVCKLSSGQVIKLVRINNKWYLEGDGPGIW